MEKELKFLWVAFDLIITLACVALKNRKRYAWCHSKARFSSSNYARSIEISIQKVQKCFSFRTSMFYGFFSLTFNFCFVNFFMLKNSIMSSKALKGQKCLLLHFVLCFRCSADIINLFFDSDEKFHSIFPAPFPTSTSLTADDVKCFYNIFKALLMVKQKKKKKIYKLRW